MADEELPQERDVLLECGYCSKTIWRSDVKHRKHPCLNLYKKASLEKSSGKVYSVDDEGNIVKDPERQCGFCQEFLKDSMVFQHSCFMRYSNVSLDHNINTLFPVTDEGVTLFEPPLYRCSMCDDLVEVHLILKGEHPCYKDYPACIIDEKRNCFYAETTDEVIEDGSVDILSECDSDLVNEENKSPNSKASVNKAKKGAAADITKLKKKKRKTTKTKRLKTLEDEDVEILISEVEKRPPLWRHDKNPANAPKTRTKANLEKLWEEVASADGLIGKISASAAKRKFKSLIDTYRQIQSAEKYSSGSARSEKKRNWRFYEIMEFTKYTVVDDDESITNVSLPEDSNNAQLLDTGGESAVDTTPAADIRSRENQQPLSFKRNIESAGPAPTKKSKTSVDPITQAIIKIANCMEKDDTTMFVPPPPPPPPPTSSSSFPPLSPQEEDLSTAMSFLISQLRHIPIEARRPIVAEIVNLATKKVQEYYQKN